MPFQVKGSLHVYCEEKLTLQTAGSNRGNQFVIHEVGSQKPVGLTCENVWSYEGLEVPFPGPLVLDFFSLPQGIPGVTKDLKTNQNLNMMLLDNLTDDTQLLIRYLFNSTPLPEVGYMLGPSNVLAQYDDLGQSMLYQFVDGLSIEVFQGDKPASIEIMLGTVSTGT